MMNKKIFGIKVSTYLLAIACVVLAIVVWVMVKMGLSEEAAASASLLIGK